MPFGLQTMASLAVAAFPVLKRLDIDVQAASVTPTLSSRGYHYEFISQPVEVFPNAYNLEELSLQGIKLSQILLPLRELKCFIGDIREATKRIDLFHDTPRLTSDYTTSFILNRKLATDELELDIKLDAEDVAFESVWGIDDTGDDESGSVRKPGAEDARRELAMKLDAEDVGIDSD
ncbi:hypothetical protein IW261DRAFT_1611947 [Armillaria novae-zelandiae]|uniref:Uncharacterized protein n=1 Tax=Armillaria novae-zelandiae TaxID=153914 RepID=A0AA39TW26_9AGAR|nr:hypothetical protein IW261DRAFT_1611947 [Armillaria novae-zelandiae]